MGKLITGSSIFGLVLRLNRFVGMDLAVQETFDRCFIFYQILDHGKPMLDKPRPAVAVYWFLRGILFEKEGVFTY